MGQDSLGILYNNRYTDGEYYRCRIVEVKEDRVLVNFVDYGNKEVCKDLFFLMCGANVRNVNQCMI